MSIALGVSSSAQGLSYRTPVACSLPRSLSPNYILPISVEPPDRPSAELKKCRPPPEEDENGAGRTDGLTALRHSLARSLIRVRSPIDILIDCPMVACGGRSLTHSQTLQRTNFLLRPNARARCCRGEMMRERRFALCLAAGDPRKFVR